MTIKCSVFIAISLDGFIARKNGDLDWLTGTEQEPGSDDYGYKDFLDSVDTLVMGRITFEQVLTFGVWPYTDKRVVVLSNGLLKIPDEFSQNAEMMSGPPPELRQRLHDTGARHVYVDGGITIQQFLRARLIDEMTITRIPVLIGDGIPLFGALDHDVRLTHIRTRTYENGFVQSKYKVIGAVG